MKMTPPERVQTRSLGSGLMAARSGGFLFGVHMNTNDPPVQRVLREWLEANSKEE